MYGESVLVTLTANLVMSSSAPSGGGIHLESDGTLPARNIIRFNTADSGGGILPFYLPLFLPLIRR